MSMLIDWCSAIKKSGPSKHDFLVYLAIRDSLDNQFSSTHISRIHFSINVLPITSAYTSISATWFATYTLNLWDLSVMCCSVCIWRCSVVFSDKLISFLMTYKQSLLKQILGATQSQGVSCEFPIRKLSADVPSIKTKFKYVMAPWINSDASMNIWTSSVTTFFLELIYKLGWYWAKFLTIFSNIQLAKVEIYHSN